MRERMILHAIEKVLAEYGIQYSLEKVAYHEYIPLGISNGAMTVLPVSRISDQVDCHAQIGSTIDDLSQSERIYLIDIRVGKFVKSVLPGIEQKEVDKITAKIIAFGTNPEFEIVSGEAIRKAYLIDNYYSTTGTLGNSCMAGSDRQLFLDLYCNEPKVRLLVLKIGNLIAGRALLWNVRYRPDKSSPLRDKVFMDRIYTNSTLDEELFKKYADDNGFMYLLNQKHNATNYVMNGYRIDFPKLRVHLKKWYRLYPYLDNMRFLTRTQGSLSNYETTATRFECSRVDGGINRI